MWCDWWCGVECACGVTGGVACRGVWCEWGGVMGRVVWGHLIFFACDWWGGVGCAERERERQTDQ